jgi:hypothetical protein
MANKKFSDFTLAISLDGTEKIVGLQSSNNARFPITFLPITKKISLSSAEILQLFTTPKTLVAAQGANTYIMPIRILVRNNFNSIAYATNINLVLANGLVAQSVFTSALGQTSNYLSSYTITSNAGSSDVAGNTNVALTLSAQTGNPTAGNGTIDVYLTYNVISL